MLSRGQQVQIETGVWGQNLKNKKNSFTSYRKLCPRKRWNWLISMHLNREENYIVEGEFGDKLLINL